MAKGQSTRSGGIPAVAYLRRSTSRQEKSLEDQRSEIERYAAANGYRILRWYQDDGISGDATERRDGFLAFHKAACNGRDFDLVLVWDQDRFGRFDSMEAGYWIHPLRKAGVRLVSVTEGPINWDDFTGRVMYSLKQEGKHQFLRDLSRNVARGQISNAQRGFLCGQAAPYGYDRMIVDEAGEHKQRVRNGEKFSKPRGWRTTLVLSDDPVKVSTVRLLFQDYAEKDVGMRTLADQLNARGVPGPSGGPWYSASIKAILENRNYTGTFTWAKRREGKYHSVAAGSIRERDRAEVTLSSAGKPLAVDNQREAWIVVENAHEAIISTDLFERVQAKITDRKRSKPGQGYRTHTKGNDDAYLLSGLVYCAHCGCKMHGSTIMSKGHRYPKYVCSTYCRSGKNNPHGCGCHSVTQEALVNLLVRKLQETVLSPKSLDRLRAAMRKALLEVGIATGSEVVTLKKQLADLDRDIDLAAANFLRAPAEVIDLVGNKLTALKRQREHVQAALRGMQSQSRTRDLEAEIEAAVAHLWRLGEEIGGAEPSRRRAVFRELVDRVELRFDRVARGKRTGCPLKSGEIYLRTGEGGIFGSVSRGDRI
jgi:site-specific DNA recombinase